MSIILGTLFFGTTLSFLEQYWNGIGISCNLSSLEQHAIIELIKSYGTYLIKNSLRYIIIKDSQTGRDMNNLRLSFFIGITVSFLTVTFLFSTPAILLEDFQEICPMGPFVEIFEDNSGEFGIEDIISDYSDKFEKYPKPTLNFGFSRSSYWIRFRILNESDSPKFRLLEIGNPSVDSIALYYPDSEGNYNSDLVKKTGRMLPFNTRDMFHRNFILFLSVDANTANTYYMRVATEGSFILPLTIWCPAQFSNRNYVTQLLLGLFYGMIVVMIFYNLFLYINLRDMSYLLFVIFSAIFGFAQFVAHGFAFQYIWPQNPALNHYMLMITSSLSLITALVLTKVFLSTRNYLPKLDKVLSAEIIILVSFIVLSFFVGFSLMIIVINVFVIFVMLSLLYIGYNSWRSEYQPARFFLISSLFLIISILVAIARNFGLLPENFVTVYSIQIGAALQVVLLSLALADRINALRQSAEIANANSVAHQQLAFEKLSESARLKDDFLQELEKKVAERTSKLEERNKELAFAIAELKSMQKKIIVQEKMASLGSLTAGIAHEIKNPLNFINNFAQLASELADELSVDISKYEKTLSPDFKSSLDEVVSTMKMNLSKINEHGKRIDGIIHGMLLHSRGVSSEKIPVDLNYLLEEYVNLAYHGMRAKGVVFNIQIIKDYDERIGRVDLFPQDISRVFINILNNAFYTLREKHIKEGQDYIPTIWVKTSKLKNAVEIRIKDNGMGIPSEIKEKIFSPFFTTKPAGEGTGLGLSISYDIIVQQHKGDIQVNSKPGKYTEFIIKLPLR